VYGLMQDRRGWFIALGSRIGCLVGFQTGNCVPNTNLVVFSIVQLFDILFNIVGGSVTEGSMLGRRGWFDAW
jgi:hypothetical protein